MSRFKQYSIVLLILLSIFFALFLFVSQNSLKEEQKVFDSFQHQSNTLISLKEKWESNKNYKKIFMRLKAISKPTKEIVKGKIYTLDFTKITQVSLEQIMKILFNSNFNIKKLNVQKNNDNISLHVEVQL